jgi:hypothetical protein
MIILGLDPSRDFAPYMDVLKCDGARGTRHYDYSVLDKMLWIETMLGDDGCKTSHIQTAENCGVHHRLIRRSTFESGEIVPTITIQPKGEGNGVKEEQVVLGIASLKTLVVLTPLLREHFLHLSSVMTPAYVSKYDQTIQMLCESVGSKVTESDLQNPETYQMLSLKMCSLASQQQDHKLKVIMYELLENSLDVVLKSILGMKAKKLTSPDGMVIEMERCAGSTRIKNDPPTPPEPQSNKHDLKRVRSMACDCSQSQRE